MDESCTSPGQRQTGAGGKLNPTATIGTNAGSGKSNQRAIRILETIVARNDYLDAVVRMLKAKEGAV